MKFSASGYSLRLGDPERAMQVIARAGFAGIESFDEMIEASGLSSPAEVRSLAEGHGVPITTHHLPFTADRDIASFYETRRLAAVDAQSRSMETAAALGAATVIQHPSSVLLDTGIEDPARYEAQLVQSLEKLAAVAGDLGLRIAVENMMNARHRCYLDDPEQIRSLDAAVRDPRVGFCLDTGHALISVGPARQHEIMDAMGDRLIAYHIQDNPGDRDLHIAPGRGCVDFAPIFERARSFDGVMCIETPPFGRLDGVSMEDEIAAWTSLIEETRALAKP